MEVVVATMIWKATNNEAWRFRQVAIRFRSHWYWDWRQVWLK